VVTSFQVDREEFHDNRTLLCYYTYSSGYFLPTFRGKLSVRNYRYSLPNNSRKRSSHMRRDGSLKSRKNFYEFPFDSIRKKKVKCTHLQAVRLWTGRTAHRGRRGIALLFLDHGIKRGWGVSVTPRPLFTPGNTRYPLYRRLGGPQGRSGQVRKISPPTRFKPRTVQPVVSRYTDWVTGTTTAFVIYG